MKIKTTVGLVGSLLFLCAQAGAITWSIQPVSGRLWNSTSTPPITLTDSYVTYKNRPNTNLVWIVPVQIDTTNSTVYSGSAAQAGDSTNTGSNVHTRLCAFSDLGIPTCGLDAVGSGPYVSWASIPATTVPANGNLFVQSSFHCGTSASCSSTLRALKVTH